jgi:hypothetical protein
MKHTFTDGKNAGDESQCFNCEKPLRRVPYQILSGFKKHRMLFCADCIAVLNSAFVKTLRKTLEEETT